MLEGSSGLFGIHISYASHLTTSTWRRRGYISAISASSQGSLVIPGRRHILIFLDMVGTVETSSHMPEYWIIEFEIPLISGLISKGKYLHLGLDGALRLLCIWTVTMCPKTFSSLQARWCCSALHNNELWANRVCTETGNLDALLSGSAPSYRLFGAALKSTEVQLQLNALLSLCSALRFSQPK